MATFILTVLVLLYLCNGGKPIPHNSISTFYHSDRHRHIRDDGGEDIIFPEPVFPRNCVHGFCEEVQDYPIDKINEAIKDLPAMIFNKLQGDKIDLPSRSGPEDEETKPLCETVQYTRYPKTAENIQNKTKYIVNVANRTQGIVLRSCVENRESQCGILPRFPDQYVTKCTQKYSHVLLVTYDENNDDEPKSKVGIDTFMVPSCCVCVYKKPN